MNSNLLRVMMRQQTVVCRQFKVFGRRQSSEQNTQRMNMLSLMRLKTVNFRGVGLPVGVGLGVIGFVQFRRIKKRQAAEGIEPGTPPIWPKWKVTVYEHLPLRTISRFWGSMARIYIPMFLREPIIGWFVRSYGVKLDEAFNNDINSYPTVAEFFRRSLKPGVRPVSDTAVVSPADGKVMNFGKCKNGTIEQIKGFNYRIDAFLGSDMPDLFSDQGDKSSNLAAKNLFYCVVYLAPGDYHAFHSPTDWSISLRRHFIGKLMSVNLIKVSNIPNLFCLNERVVMAGKWKYGFFSMTAVGATNVGSIKLEFDKDLKTNTRHWIWQKIAPFQDKLFFRGVAENRGEKIGEFNLGSTVVLVFEAPENFEFVVKSGQKINYGESLGILK